TLWDGRWKRTAFRWKRRNRARWRGNRLYRIWLRIQRSDGDAAHDATKTICNLRRMVLPGFTVGRAGVVARGGEAARADPDAPIPSGHGFACPVEKFGPAG